MAKRNFLGKGWKFPVSVNGAGGIGTSDNERSVEEAIEIILGTAPGEPRIDGNEEHADCDALDDNKLLLYIHYRVVAENNLFNLVYPFYLRREQDL